MRAESIAAIDRQFQVARGLRNDPRLAGVPIYLIGGEEPTNIYMRNFRGEFTLDGIERLANPDSARYKHLLSAREPMIVVATSGMVNYGTPSYHWAKQVMREAKSAICFVGFQNPSSTGGRLLQFKGHPGETFRFPDGDRRTLHCRIEQVDMSAHMKEEEAIELEARLNPRLVVHVHGERRRILDYVAGQRGKGPARIAATVGQEIEI